jgi:hypothetical protein
MAIHEHTTIALYDDGGEQIGNYTMGEEEFRLLDGKHSVAFNVTEAADLIAFLQRVQDMQKPKFVLGEPEWKPEWQVTEVRTSEPTPSVWLPNCKPGDVCVHRDGERDPYRYNDGSDFMPHNVGGYFHHDNGRVSNTHESQRDIVAVIPSDHSGPSGTACDTLAKEYAR